MSPRLRRLVLVPALGVIAGLLVAGLAGLPDFGHYVGPYGNILNRIGVPKRGTDNVVGATVFDFRAIDTLGEEFILYAAVLGVALLLRGRREESPPRDEQGSDVLRVWGLLMIGPAVVIAAWLAAFGYITPGGGFQGGVVLAAAVLLIYLAAGFHSYGRAASEERVDVIESVGAGGFVVIGLAALVSGLPFLANLLGPGDRGTLTSGGSIPFLNWASAIEVAAANVLLFLEFLAAYVAPLVKREDGS